MSVCPFVCLSISLPVGPSFCLSVPPYKILDLRDQRASKFGVNMCSYSAQIKFVLYFEKFQA